jgi:hypothetical protein
MLKKSILQGFKPKIKNKYKIHNKDKMAIV